MTDFPEQVKKDLEDINAVAKDLKMKVFVAGGFPRDIVTGKGIYEETDLDLTEANGNSFDLAFFVSAKYNLAEPVVYEGSGTALIIMPSGRPVEFHNAFHDSPHIIDQLYLKGVKPTPLNKDVYSRDFTINTLLYDVDTGEILDLTKQGLRDIEERILRTPIDPKKVLSLKPKNILRGIRFKIQLNLTESEEYQREVPKHIPDLIAFLKEHPDSQMVAGTVRKTLKIDPKQAVEEYKRYGILPYLPKEIEIDDVMKEELFGTTITPTGVPVVAQTKMMQRLMNEREKHKAYMRRKKREDKQKKTEMLKILDRARTGYYLENPEPEFVKDRKVDRKRKIFDYIQSRNYDNA